jgi:hypothetical protein
VKPFIDEPILSANNESNIAAKEIKKLVVSQPRDSLRESSTNEISSIKLCITSAKN